MLLSLDFPASVKGQIRDQSRSRSGSTQKHMPIVVSCDMMRAHRAAPGEAAYSVRSKITPSASSKVRSCCNQGTKFRIGNSLGFGQVTPERSRFGDFKILGVWTSSLCHPHYYFRLFQFTVSYIFSLKSQCYRKGSKSA